MKNLGFFMVLSMMTSVAVAVPQTPGRRAMSDQFVDSGRGTVVASKNQLARMPAIRNLNSKVSLNIDQNQDQTEEKDMREKEKAACLNNNIGVGNTFVWASRYSNVGNYASMVEDVENPENNVCFVRVELKSDDNRINISDVAAVYYPMGTTITCGAWADEGMIKDRILAAKKSGRTWGTVAGAVGGAGIGVGAMELFGNELIGGKVEGQHDLEGTELIRSQLAVLRKEDQATYNRFRDWLIGLRDACENPVWAGAKPDACNNYDYVTLLSVMP